MLFRSSLKLGIFEVLPQALRRADPMLLPGSEIITQNAGALRGSLKRREDGFVYEGYSSFGAPVWIPALALFGGLFLKGTGP